MEEESGLSAEDIASVRRRVAAAAGKSRKNKKR
jgi:hypothetical protein